MSMSMNTLATYEKNPVPTLAPGIAARINTLHADVRRIEKESRKALDKAVATAWQAGKLLTGAKQSIVRHGGRGAWVPWVKSEFRGGLRTAQRYMKLARELSAPSSLPGLSLRQVYFRLGIATEPKRPAICKPVGKLPAHICLANKLLRAIRNAHGRINAQDLAALYADLRRLFESQRTA